MRRLRPVLFACLALASACAAPTDASDEEPLLGTPPWATEIDLDALTPMDAATAAPWLDAALAIDDTAAIEGFYAARGCGRAYPTAQVLVDRLSDRAEPEILRGRFESAGWIDGDDGRYVVVRQAVDCGSQEPVIVTVFAADAIDDVESAGWIRSYGELFDEAQNLYERVEVRDGEVCPHAISLNPPAVYDED